MNPEIETKDDTIKRLREELALYQETIVALNREVRRLEVLVYS